MRKSPSIRRLVELLALAAVLFTALLGTVLLLRDDVLLDLLDSLHVWTEIRTQEREEARRFGAHLEAQREREVAAVERSLVELRESRGAFRGGISALAIDAKERVLVGGTGPSGFLLGVVRFLSDGRLDERFFDHVSRAFEDDSVVGGVSQLLPLEDGRILRRHRRHHYALRPVADGSTRGLREAPRTANSKSRQDAARLARSR